MKFLVLSISLIMFLSSCQQSQSDNPTPTVPDTQEGLKPGVVQKEIIVDQSTNQSKKSKMAQVKNGEVLPTANFIDYKSQDLSLDDYKGKIVVVDLWATWCAPCVDAIPSFDLLKESMKSNTDIVFLKVSIDTDKELWTEYVKQYSITDKSYWIGLDEDNPLLWFSFLEMNYEGKDMVVESIPKYMIIGKDGRVLNNNAPSPKNTDLLSEIKKHIS